VASQRLARLAARLKAETAKTEADHARHALLAADIKRFLERPGEVGKMVPAADAPPGAPIGGDPGMDDWLAPAPWRAREQGDQGGWFWTEPPF
jgi:hypothetical protein